MSREEAAENLGPLGTVRGIVHQPAARVRRGTALILHGFFSSTKVGPARLYVQIARLLCSYGYAVWRFDCYGVGDSDGEFSETSYESELNDYRSILRNPNFQGSGECVLVGHSMGTSMAVILASENSEVSRLLLLSPSIGRMTWPENLFTDQQMEDLRTTGRTVRKGIEINASFVESLQSETALISASALSIPVTVVHGLADEFYSVENARRVANALRAKRIIELPDSDHNFLYQNARNKLLGNLEEEINTWRREERL